MNIMTRFMKWILLGNLTAESGGANAAHKRTAPERDTREEPEDWDGYLEYYEHGVRQHVELPEGVTSVGSSRRADCVIDAPSMSAIHAEIIRKGMTYFFKNLSSHGKTYVNGVLLYPYDVKPIQSGAHFSFGGMEIAFRRWSDISTPEASAFMKGEVAI